MQNPTDGRAATCDRPLPYLAGLDGLRALAVIAVLLYHAGLPWIPGGFLGVEVFFVISGYLITGLLLAEWRQQGRIDLKAFWLRRARRLLPALLLLIVVTLAFAVVFLPDEVAGLRGDVLAALGYVTNWYFVLGHKSYFETVGRPSLLQHLWSLAIEEQFYLLWPLLLTIGLRRWPRKVVLGTVLIGAAVSTVLMAMLYRLDVDPSRPYYGTDTRAGALLIGSALAFVWMPGQRQHRTGWTVPLLLDIFSLGAFGVLVWFCLRIDAFQPFLYRGGFAAVAMATAVMIATAVHPRARLSPGLLEWWPLRWIGLRSYSIYLWHWPVFMVTRPQLDVPIDGLSLLALRMVITVVLADLSYRYVETPIRSGAVGQAWRAVCEAHGARRWRLATQWAGVIGTIGALCIMLGMVVASARPPASPAYLSAQMVHTELEAVIHRTAVATVTAESRPVQVPVLTPTNVPMPAPARQVTAIGDSVMISAAQELEQVIGNLTIDAAQARQVPNVIDILQARQDAGHLGEVVIIHIGNNGPLSAEQFDEMMQILVDVSKVVFVNVKVPRFWEGPNNNVLLEGVKRYPNSVLVDWHAASSSQLDLFWDDGIHLRPEGALVYAQLVARQIKIP
jgi:peptidoglycan/LPS O-acetylase OafA/YrhL